MQRHEEERGNQNRNRRSVALFDGALHVPTKAGFFANPRTRRQSAKTIMNPAPSVVYGCQSICGAPSFVGKEVDVGVEHLA